MSSDFLSQNDFNAAKVTHFFVLCKFFAVFFIQECKIAYFGYSLT